MKMKFTGSIVDSYEIVGDGFFQAIDSKEELEKELIKYIEAGKEVKVLAINELHYKVVDEEQTAKWITTRTLTHDGEWYCSNCDYELYGTYDVEDLPDVCPCCGKKMNVNY